MVQLVFFLDFLLVDDGGITLLAHQIKRISEGTYLPTNNTGFNIYHKRLEFLVYVEGTFSSCLKSL